MTSPAAPHRESRLARALDTALARYNSSPVRPAAPLCNATSGCALPDGHVDRVGSPCLPVEWRTSEQVRASGKGTTVRRVL